MLNLKQIHRLVHAKAYGRLTQRILTNGRCQDPRIIARLLEPRAAAPAALGLALQRLHELTWGPCPDSQAILHRLLACQVSNGLFGQPAQGHQSHADDDPVSSGSLASTAIALRSISLYLEEKEGASNKGDARLAHRLVVALDRAVDAVASCLANQLTGQFTIDEVDAAIVLWQLADREALASRLPLHQLELLIRRRASSWSHADELFAFAHASAA